MYIDAAKDEVVVEASRVQNITRRRGSTDILGRTLLSRAQVAAGRKGAEAQGFRGCPLFEMRLGAEPNWRSLVAVGRDGGVRGWCVSALAAVC